MNSHPQRVLQILSAAWGMGAVDQRCSEGPLYLAQHQSLEKLTLPAYHWQKAITPLKDCRDAVVAISQMSLQLARQVDHCVLNKELFVTLGGDHSCAIGTWSGAAHALAPKGNLGLIWIDAHMDAHTFATTPSKQIHGMPVACLLGYGEASLIEVLQKTPKIKLGVRCFKMDEVAQKGLDTVVQEAIHIVTQGTIAYGVSIDLDGLDPDEAPGVGSKVAGGLGLQALADALACYVCGDARFIGAELAEFNPHWDVDDKTVHCIQVLLEALFV
ncbi:MAG: arginase family protein [Gammaproteobacteria bacterium]|nr:arginase family protein [Gammaproteobacteria bacterium]